jgi:hypothetical protein
VEFFPRKRIVDATYRGNVVLIRNLSPWIVINRGRCSGPRE